MADGNFNRSMLPQNNYASGVRAGEARMKARALEVLKGLVDDATFEKFREALKILVLFLILPLSGFAQVEYVNPLMGTDSSRELSTGNTYPAVSRPWGMNFWTPQTGENGDGWQYTYKATHLRGFKQTHQPSPWMGDYAYFSVMPLSDPKHVTSWFSHKTETVMPHYYKVYLADEDLWTEMTATERCAAFRVTTLNDKPVYLAIDTQPEKGATEFTKIDDINGVVEGWVSNHDGGVPKNFRNHFVVKFQGPFKKISQKNGRLVIECPAEFSVASSFISQKQAQLNLQREIGEKSFDTLVSEGLQAWNKQLGRIEVSGGTADQKRTFYSCLYRSLLFPRQFHEYDAQNQPWHYGPDGEIHKGVYYTDTGFWDTFRALMPFLNLVYPEVSEDIVEGLLNCYRESGFFPEWASPGHRNCMIGNNSAAVLADAFVKGIPVSDAKLMYEGLQHGRHAHLAQKASGRLGHEWYNKLGYVPCDVGINENAARTLEYAYDDWCILQVAKALNRPKKEIAELEKAAQNYRHLFDPTYNLMRGKKKDGTFPKEFNPFKWGGDFTEGNAWHYTWSVFHDIDGLKSLMNGKFETMLDSVMKMPPVFDDSYYGGVIHEIREMQIMGFGQYAHGNQPIQHMLYLYDWTAHPEKGRYWIRQVMDRLYSPTPDGYCGDEDNGQTSAWYVFSALGFYPVCPGSLDYAVGAPLFDEAKIHFKDGTVTLKRGHGTRRFIRHEDFQNKTTIEL